MSERNSQSSSGSPDLVEVVETASGPMLLLKTDTVISEQLRVTGQYAPEEQQLLSRIIQPGDTVIDAGANIGNHTLFFARAVGPGGFVLSFEAQRFLSQILCGNVALNSLLNVRCYNNAVGAACGEVQVPVPDYRRRNNYGGFPLDFKTRKESGTMVTLDAIGVVRCDLIKIDVEGMELDVLEGAKRTILSHLPVLYLENNRPDKSGPLLDYISETLQYRIFKHGPNVLCFSRGKPLADDVWKGLKELEP